MGGWVGQKRAKKWDIICGWPLMATSTLDLIKMDEVNLTSKKELKLEIYQWKEQHCDDL